MGLNGLRTQLLANLRFLHGPDVEVLTLYNDTLSYKYQAVAMKFDSLAATWTKYLHTEMRTSTQDAIETLLEMSERELTSFLSAAGNTVPFQGAELQTLHREQQGNSIPVIFATPTSTLSRTTSDDLTPVEHVVEETAEPLLDESPVKEAVMEDVDETSLAEESISVSGEHSQISDPFAFTFDDIQPAEEKPIEVPVEEPTVEPVADDGFGWLSKKDKKKKKAAFTFDDIQPAEEKPIEVPVEEPTVEPIADDGFGWLSKKDKKKAAFTFDDIQPAEEEPIEVLVEEPTDEPVADDGFGWLSKKDKKKKNKKAAFTFDDIQPVEESIPLPEPELVSYPVEECEEPKEEEPQSIPSSPSSPPSLPCPSEPQPGFEDRVPGPLGSEALLLPASAHVVQTRRTVILKIELPDDISKKPLQAMRTIAHDTRTAIIDSVTSYLDSKGILKDIQGQLMLEIKSGVGRDGDVDLSTLEETMWPDCLEYFYQVTRIPELTIGVVECQEQCW